MALDKQTKLKAELKNMQTIIFLVPELNHHFDAFVTAARIEPKQIFVET